MDTETSDYSFGHVYEDEELRFLYAFPDDSSPAGSRWQLEDSVEAIMDFEDEVGWRPYHISDYNVAAIIDQAEEYCQENGLDEPYFAFKKKSDQEWRQVIQEVWHGLTVEEDLERRADGGQPSKPVKGHAYPGQNIGKGFNHSEDTFRFD